MSLGYYRQQMEIEKRKVSFGNILQFLFKFKVVYYDFINQQNYGTLQLYLQPLHNQAIL